jgi:hypothetical protein
LELLTAGAAQAGQILTAALADRLERAEITGTLAYASLVTVRVLLTGSKPALA